MTRVTSVLVAVRHRPLATLPGDTQKNLRKLQSLMTLRNTGDMIFKAFLSNAAERRRQQRGHALANGSAQPKGVGLVLRKPKWLRVRCN